MHTRHAQSNVVYMNYFILLGLIFLGFIFVFSSSFSDSSTSQMKEHISDSIFARIETGVFELKALQNQTAATSLTKTVSIPRKMGEIDYNIIGNSGQITLQAVGKNAFYKTKSIHWQDISFAGSTNSQNAQAKLTLNTTSNQIIIS